MSTYITKCYMHQDIHYRPLSLVLALYVCVIGHLDRKRGFIVKTAGKESVRYPAVGEEKRAEQSRGGVGSLFVAPFIEMGLRFWMVVEFTNLFICVCE